MGKEDRGKSGEDVRNSTTKNYIFFETQNHEKQFQR